MNYPQPPILLVSLTARMLAELAVAAGYPVIALDYFGDVDLQALCPTYSLRRDFGQAYSAAALVEAAATIQASRVVFGASLENHPLEVERLGRGRQLLGNPSRVLAQVRHPATLAATLQAGGFNFPETRWTPSPELAAADRRWLWKPLKSGGGHSIRYWRGGPLPEDGYLQEKLAGLVCSAVFVGNGEQAVLLGLTEQLVGLRAFGADKFRYCGNVLPPRLPPAELTAMLAEVAALVQHLTRAFHLQGLNGVDFIWHQQRAWTVEVNPRPSASLELVERAYGLRVFDWHVRSFAGQLPDFRLAQALQTQLSAGKAILFATGDVTVGNLAAGAGVGLRDVPQPGERIRSQHPICTLLAQDTTPDACLRQLRQKATRVKRLLRSTAGAGSN